MSDEPSEPTCANCLGHFSWNEMADRDEPDPLCDGCAHELGAEVPCLRATIASMQRELVEARRLLREAQDDRDAFEATNAAVEMLFARAASEDVDIPASNLLHETVAWLRAKAPRVADK